MAQNHNGNNHDKKRYPVLLGYVLALAAGVIVSSVWWYWHGQAAIRSISTQIKPLRQQNNPYRYINPLLGYEVPGDVKEFNKYQPMDNAVKAAVAQASPAGLAGYSFYFRDLSLGRWTGINENTGYQPASLMKVAIMIAYFKQAETNPDILDKTLNYSAAIADEINGVPMSSPSDLQVGKSYAVEQLIEAMIVSSDNGAKNALLNDIDQATLNDIYTDLGLPNPNDSDNYTITPKQYSLLLRILYNATYLSRGYSEKALSIMSRAKYAQGLAAGVPTGTAVAQKFGENVNINAGAADISLSNCGIVYHPTHPYILCVMTKGTDLDALTKTIALISKTAWDQVSAYAAGKQ